MKLRFVGLVIFGLQGIGCSGVAQDMPNAQSDQDRIRDAASGLRTAAAAANNAYAALPASAGVEPFDGEWTVAWCDTSRPGSDCGGFNLGLVQTGSRLCGTYDSARAGLSQIDEGGRVLGTARGETATLTIESERSGGKYTANASIRNGRLHWKLQETLLEASQDIDIVAIDEMLERRPIHGDLAVKHAELASDCQTRRTRQDRNRPSTRAATTSIGSTLRPGEYVTEKGWGHLQIKAQTGALTFSIHSVIGEDYCELDGTIDGKRGVAKADSRPTACIVELTNGPRGVNVTASTPAECRTFCGDNGSFEGDYRTVGDGCGRNDLARTRATFKQLYDKGSYREALATLSPVLSNCGPTLDWEEEGGIRNDLAITQFRNGLYAQCLATLEKYAEDADRDDDEVIETWPPALADRYLGIIRAARTNIALCRKRSGDDRG